MSGSASSVMRFQRFIHLCKYPRCYVSGNFAGLSSAVPHCDRVLFSTVTEAANSSSEPQMESELNKRPREKYGFKAETKKLLEIVAKSLYSDKEIFVRELISNASDAIERLRLLSMSGKLPDDKLAMEIHVITDQTKKLLIIRDTGVGMTREELASNLGTIARSGSREFVSNLDSSKSNLSSQDIIGQFGVGFYASFMVADKVEVFSRSQLESNPNGLGHCWSSTGDNGEFVIGEAENVQPGTKIILHLKEFATEFAREDVLERILQKYNNFVSTPIFLNGRRINTVEPLWTKDQSQITNDEHSSFYQYLSNNKHDVPRYTFMYKTDAPINLRVLLYVPGSKPSIFDMAREGVESSVTLYSRKVMLLSRADALLPKWLRFFRGVVDSEDVPLNLSRELLQDNALILRIRRLLTSRILQFFSQQSSHEPEKFCSFLDDFDLYLKEGLVLEEEQGVREKIAKLLKWESSALPSGQKTTLDEYAGRMRAGERNIYFLSAPNRQLAENSPYLEALRKKSSDTEILFLYKPYDELVLMQLSAYDKKQLKALETMLADDLTDTDSVGPERSDYLTQEAAAALVEWSEKILTDKVKKVKISQRLTNHPCFVSIREAGAMRHFLNTSLADRPTEEKYRVMQPILELNPEHKLIRYLHTLFVEQDYQTAEAILNHLFEAAMAEAGLMDDVRGLASRVTELMTMLVEDKVSCK